MPYRAYFPSVSRRACAELDILVPTLLCGHEPQATDEVNALWDAPTEDRYVFSVLRRLKTRPLAPIGGERQREGVLLE